MSDLTQEAIEARREYFREWGKKNKEKRKISNARYWEKYAAQKRAEKERGVQSNDTNNDQ